MPVLAAEAAYFAVVHAVDADGGQLLLHFFELGRTDDDFELFHDGLQIFLTAGGESRQLQGVAAFVVQAEVQAPDLGGGIHTQAHQGIRQLQQDAADQVNEAPGGDDGDDLDHELPRVAVEQTVDAVDAGGGEQAGGKGAQVPPTPWMPTTSRASS